jgi:hypothetical protein
MLPSHLLRRALYCTLDLFLFPVPTPEIRIEAGRPLNPASLAYWCVTRDICAPVSHSTEYISPLASGIRWIISCIFSCPPPPQAVASIRHPPPPPYAGGGLLASWRRGGWLGSGSLPSSVASFPSLTFSCVRFLSLFRVVSFLLVHAV